MKQLIILITILGCCDPALACSCADTTTTENYSQASKVFRACIESVDIVTIPEHLKDDSWLMLGSSGPLPRVVQARFELLETYKGSPQDLDAVYTSPSSIGCGLRIADGSQYVFFADAKGVVNLCGGNTRRTLFSRKFKDTIKNLKRLVSQQLDQEKTAGPEAPEKSR